MISLGTVTGILAIMALYQQIFGPHTKDITDIYDHLLTVKDMSPQGPWCLYSLFFVLVYALSFGSKSYYVLALVATVVLTACIILKGILSYYVIEKAAKSELVAAFISLGLILAMPLPNWWKPDEIYIDKIAPNIWFNSTAILNMPFDILLFFSTLKWLKASTGRAFISMAVFTLLSVLTKPNYILAFIPVIGCVVLGRTLTNPRVGALQRLLSYSALVFGVCGILWLQYVDTFTTTPISGPSSGKEESSIILAPFAVWKVFSPNIPASLLLSVAFPLSFAVLYFREVKNEASLALAWAVWAVATLQYVLLAETGEAFNYANWIWASNFAMYIVFLVSAKLLISERRSPRFYLVAIIFCLHVASGIYHYVKVACGAGYY